MLSIARYRAFEAGGILIETVFATMLQFVSAECNAFIADSDK